MPERRKAPSWMIRVDKTLYERIGHLAEQNHRTIRAQASLLLERALDEAQQQQEHLRVAGEAAERRRWPALASVGRTGEVSDG